MTKQDIFRSIAKLKPPVPGTKNPRSTFFITADEWYQHFTIEPKRFIYSFQNYTKYQDKFEGREYATKQDKGGKVFVFIRWS